MMMKKLIIFSGLIVLATSAFATGFENIYDIANLNPQNSGQKGLASLTHPTPVINAASPQASLFGHNLVNQKYSNKRALFPSNCKEITLNEALIADRNYLNICSVNQNLTSSGIVNFSGKSTQKGSVLIWRTTSEENNKGFEIERSTNAIEFEKIGFKGHLSINGTSIEPIDYTFVDIVSDMDTYYRLKQVDTEGKSEYSPIILVKAFSDLKSKINTSDVDDLKMMLSSNKSDVATLLLLDDSGNVVYQKKETIVKGNNNICINTLNLRSGCYVLQVKNSLGVMVLTRKIVEI